MSKKLTPKQLKFNDEYMIDLNATKSAERSGYSKKTAQRIGSENLSKPLISEEIKKRQEKLSSKAEYTVETHLKSNKRMIEVFDMLLELGMKENLTIEEELKFSRLMGILKASDANKAKEITNKMLGWNKELDEPVVDKVTSIKIDIIRKDGH